MRIAVIGKSGQLAQELLRKNELRIELTAYGREDINLLDSESLIKTLSHFQPQAIINASAYTAVDKAETDKEQAFLLNVKAVESLAHYCKARNIHLVHISTDYVFKGDKGAPYLVSDPREPQGVYGQSKADGEASLLKIWPDQSCIIRTSWVYSVFGNNFVKTMLRLMNEKESLGVIDDQIGSPTWASGLADAAIFAAINKIIGIHHWSDLGVASWYDFSVAIQQIAYDKGMLDKKIDINPIPTKAYPTPAKRPSYSVMDKTSLFEDFKSVSKRHWRAQLESMLCEFESNKIT